MLDSIYHMTLKLLKNHIFVAETSRFCHLLRIVTMKVLPNINKSVIDFIACCYVTPKCGVMWVRYCKLKIISFGYTQIDKQA